jgi:hypothetical protein
MYNVQGGYVQSTEYKEIYKDNDKDRSINDENLNISKETELLGEYLMLVDINENDLTLLINKYGNKKLLSNLIKLSEQNNISNPTAYLQTMLMKDNRTDEEISQELAPLLSAQSRLEETKNYIAENYSTKGCFEPKVAGDMLEDMVKNLSKDGQKNGNQSCVIVHASS